MPQCPHCAGEIPEGATHCPECGRDLRPVPPQVDASPSKARVAGGLGCAIVGALLALVGIALLFGLLAGGLLG